MRGRGVIERGVLVFDNKVTLSARARYESGT